MRLRAGGEARRPFVMEYRLRSADGVYRWVLDSGAPKYDPDGSFAGYIGCSMDITERKDAEDRNRESQAALEVSHREIRHLAGRLIEAQDAERARIARDLHDDVSQQLAGMSIAFSGLRQRLGESHVSADLQDDLQSLQRRTSALVKNVRHLTRPPSHRTPSRGLVAALTSYCAELERTHGTVLTCSAEASRPSLLRPRCACTGLPRKRYATSSPTPAVRAEVRLVRTGEMSR